MTVTEECPLIIDEARTIWDEEKGRNREYATPESVQEACRVIGKAGLAAQDITFRDHTGPFADVAAEVCEISHLSLNWPQGFMVYAGLIEAAEAARSKAT